MPGCPDYYAVSSIVSFCDDGDDHHPTLTVSVEGGDYDEFEEVTASAFFDAIEEAKKR